MRRKLLTVLTLALVQAGCYAQKRDDPTAVPSPKATASPPPAQVGLVPFSDISGHQAGAAVTSLIERRLSQTIAVKRLTGEGFLAGGLLIKAFELSRLAPVVMGRISAYEFQRQKTRRLGPPDYD